VSNIESHAHGKGETRRKVKGKSEVEERCRGGRAAQESGTTEAAVMSALYSFGVIGECVHVEPQYCHGVTMHCQTLLLPFISARCETSLRPFMEAAVSKPNLRHDDSSHNKATGKGLLQAGRAALASNYFGAKMCTFVCSEEQAKLLLCPYSSKSMGVYQGSGPVYAGIGSTVAQHISVGRQIKRI